MPSHMSEGHDFVAEWNEGGVCVYQAYNDAIADWAVAHQRLGGPDGIFAPTRMTWFKPSFAWVLYRSGYASKHNQTRVLKLTLPHEALASLLSECQCRPGGGGSLGRVQWDPARDLLAPEPKDNVPRRMQWARAIQIGVAGRLAAQYASAVSRVVDVTDIARQVGSVHKLLRSRRVATQEAGRQALRVLQQSGALPQERPYTPACAPDVLRQLHVTPAGLSLVSTATVGARDLPGVAAGPHEASVPLIERRGDGDDAGGASLDGLG
eukprot:TRINITY_DN32847_c0_g1_i1.p1 TRINITY_DN32847_c0_g1~~TRINITY_DN32847_c0_g1_i1.p1  ORF type:complete len:266 (-),score=8.30 TRINITY_DN32847_c0_g1_i1:664-1461(-)